MSKPRWRWATRDTIAVNDGKYERCLWTARPTSWAMDETLWIRPTLPGHVQCGIKAVDAAYFRKRFGRDLRPGQKVRLP